MKPAQHQHKLLLCLLLAGCFCVVPATSTIARVEITNRLCQGYANKRKPFDKRQVSIRGMMVRRMNSSGMMVGTSMDIIATVATGQKPQGDNVLRFAHDTQAVGPMMMSSIGNEMKISMDEAVRAARVRYPTWEESMIEVSFGDKYSPKDGGSAGGAFTLLLFAMLDGLDYEDGLAMTGDVTVDWKLRKVGGVPEKIRGARATKCKMVIMPKANERDVADMLLLYDADILWDVEIFAAETVTEAVEIARVDREERIAKARKTFAEIQKFLKVRKESGLRHQGVQKGLVQILKACPNHMSAKYLYLKSRGKLPKKLSLETSMSQLFVSLGPIYYEIFYSEEMLQFFGMPETPEGSYGKAASKLRALSPKLDDDAIALHRALINYITLLDKEEKIVNGQGSRSSKARQLRDLEPKIEEKKEKLMSVLEEYRENQDFMERIMN